MPFTVSCPACASRFLLSEDLFRRKVSGKVVRVKCRNCSAEISVDATEPATLPSQEPPPHRHPAPPRPKPKAGAAASTTPLPTPASESLSIWDAQERAPAPARKPPPARRLELDFSDEIEEPPPSSSDAPSLNSLTHESAPKRRFAPKKAPDEFLVNLSAGNGGILGAPTIDVTGLGSPPPPGVEELLEVEATELTPQAGTIPLFDMSAVLPAAAPAPTAAVPSLSPSHVDLDIQLAGAGNRAATARERKHVIAPQSTEAPARRRGGGGVWFALVAAAAGVVAIVGIRGHGSRPPAAPEPEAARPSVLADNTPAGREAVPPSASAASEVSPIASADAREAATAEKAEPATALVATGTSAPSGTGSAAKDSDQALPTSEGRPKTDSAAAVEKPTQPEEFAALTPTAVEAPTPAPEPAEPGTEFDRGAAVTALKAAAAEAAACRKDGDPSGTASLTITFAPSGRVTSASILGPPFAGTPTGGCIANAMRHARVPAFSGDRVTVSKTIVVQ